MRETARRLRDAVVARSDAIEAALGLGLITAGVWLTFSLGVACIVSGTVMFVLAVFGRRIT